MTGLSVHTLAHGIRNRPARFPFTAQTQTQALAAGSILTSRKAVEQGSGVHFSVSADAAETIAAAKGVSAWRVQCEAEYYWSFSDSEAENYPFDVLSNDMICPRTAGNAAGPFAAHVYETEGPHVARLWLFFEGVVYEASTEIQVSAFDLAHRIVGVLAADADTYAAETGLVPAHTYANFDDAATALNADAIDTLLLERGKTYPVTRAKRGIPAGSVIDAFGSGAKPIIDATGVELWNPPGLDEIPTASQTDFVSDGENFLDTSAYPNGVAVYVNDVLQTEIDDYTIETTDTPNDTIKFTAGLAVGERVLALRRAADGAIVPRGNALFRVEGSNVRLRNFVVRGSYDAADPSGPFDPNDLTTYDHSILLDVLSTFGDISNLTIFGVEASGVRALMGVDVATSANLFFVNCKVTDWFNYGAYLDGWIRTCFVGCDIRQNLAALNGPGGKTDNSTTYRNYPWHGPIRAALSYEQVINRCRFDSRSNWAGIDSEGEASWQPIARVAQSNVPNQSYAIAENHSTGGTSVWGGGVQNSWNTLARGGLTHAQNNISFIPGIGALGLWGLTSINNLWCVAKGPDGDPDNDWVFTSFGDPTVVLDPDVRTDGHYIRNDTVIVPDWADAPSNWFAVALRNVVSEAGLHNIASGSYPGGSWTPGPYAVSGTPTTITVTVKTTATSDQPDQRWRIWRGPSDDPASATSFGTLSAQGHPAANGFPAKTGGAYTIRQLDGAGVETASVSDTEQLEITINSGAFANGDHIWATREAMVEGRSRINAAGTARESDTAEPETFPVNNRATDFALDPPTIHNVQIVADADRADYYLYREDLALDAAAYASATRTDGPLSAWAQPQAGSSAIAAGTVASYKDVFGTLRGDDTDLGAIEAATDASALGALPYPPVVTFDWADTEAMLTAGDTLDETDLSVTISDAGEPALTLGDVTLYYRVTPSGAGEPNDLVLATDGVTVSAGDTIVPVADYAHLMTGLRLATATGKIAAAASTTPSYMSASSAIYNAVDLAINDSPHVETHTLAGLGPNERIVIGVYAASKDGSGSGVSDSITIQGVGGGAAVTATAITGAKAGRDGAADDRFVLMAYEAVTPSDYDGGAGEELTVTVAFSGSGRGGIHTMVAAVPGCNASVAGAARVGAGSAAPSVDGSAGDALVAFAFVSDNDVSLPLAWSGGVTTQASVYDEPETDIIDLAAGVAAGASDTVNFTSTATSPFIDLLVVARFPAP